MTLQLVISVVKMDNIIMIIYYNYLSGWTQSRRRWRSWRTRRTRQGWGFASLLAFPFSFVTFVLKKTNKLLFNIGLLTSKTSRPPMNWRFFSTNNNEYLLLSSQSSLIIPYPEHQSTSNNQRLNFFPLQAEKYEDQLKNVQKKIQVNWKI